jgi:putative phosphoesterase
MPVSARSIHKADYLPCIRESTMPASCQDSILTVTCAEASRIAILSDTHGRLDPRIAGIVASCDCAVHAGDIGSAAVLAALRPRMETVVAVLGNNDVAGKLAADDWALLRDLPLEAGLELKGGLLVVVHGHKAGPASRRHAWLRGRYPLGRAIVYGHSHRLVCDQAQAPWVLNPGSAGLTRTFGGPSCQVLTTGSGRWSIETVRFPPPATAALRSKSAGR